MSPASQGGLQVERYIGTCLISKADAPRYPHHGAWAGLPLISMVQPRRNKPPPQQQQQHQQHQQQHHQQHQPQPARSPLSRLAIHAQGAPLILAGRYNNRKHGQPGGPGGPGGPNGQGANPGQQHQGLGQNMGQGLGQQGYKGGPRGHRPLAPPPPCAPLGPPLGPPLVPSPPCGPCGPCGPLPPATNKQAAASSDSLSVASDESSGHSENSLPRIIKPRKRRKKDRKPLQLASDAAHATSPPPQPPAAVPTVSLKSLGGEAEPADEPKLHHDFDEVKEHESGDEGVLLCQCRYCDPAGLIWDVDQNCYSPFLTPQPQRAQQPLASLFEAAAARFPDLGHPDLGHGAATRGASDLLLRRSWSEPTPSRKHSESSDSQDSDRRTPPSRHALEVSSEIVTSHYGHRDIEIKFFSAPTSASDLDCRQ